MYKFHLEYLWKLVLKVSNYLNCATVQYLSTVNYHADAMWELNASCIHSCIGSVDEERSINRSNMLWVFL